VAYSQIVQPQFGQAAAQLSQGRYNRIGLRHLTESIIAQIEAATFQEWPGKAVGFAPDVETIGLEGAAFVDAIININGSNQLILYSGIAIAQSAQHRDIDRRAVVLHGTNSGHVPSAQQSPKQVDIGQHARQ